MDFTPTVQRVCFNGCRLHVWRDDLYDLAPGLSGNKARKLYSFLVGDLADATTLVSYGSAQSSMLYSLSELACLQSWQLEFFVDHIADNLAQNPRGNYARALANGAHIRAVTAENLHVWARDHARQNAGALFIPEGGRHAESEPGLALLAQDIEYWVAGQGLANPKLVLPSGTGTTAFYLQKHLPIEVLTCACVGDAEYLQQQFAMLDSEAPRYSSILLPNKKYHFGKLYPEFYDLWRELKAETGIEFELLYDPLGWLCLLDYMAENPSVDLIYLHQGGQLGNATMLERYRRKLENLGLE